MIPMLLAELPQIHAAILPPLLPLPLLVARTRDARTTAMITIMVWIGIGERHALILSAWRVDYSVYYGGILSNERQNGLGS